MLTDEQIKKEALTFSDRRLWDKNLSFKHTGFHYLAFARAIESLVRKDERERRCDLHDWHQAALQPKEPT